MGIFNSKTFDESDTNDTKQVTNIEKFSLLKDSTSCKQK